MTVSNALTRFVVSFIDELRSQGYPLHGEGIWPSCLSEHLQPCLQSTRTIAIDDMKHLTQQIQDHPMGIILINHRDILLQPLLILSRDGYS